MSDPIGTFECPYCGLDHPHHHETAQVEELRWLRVAREAFEVWFDTSYTNRHEHQIHPVVDVIDAVGRFFNHYPLVGLGNRFRLSDEYDHRMMGRWVRPYAHPVVELAWRIWRESTLQAARILNKVDAGEALRQRDEAMSALSDLTDRFRTLKESVAESRKSAEQDAVALTRANEAVSAWRDSQEAPRE